MYIYQEHEVENKECKKKQGRKTLKSHKIFTAKIFPTKFLYISRHWTRKRKLSLYLQAQAVAFGIKYDRNDDNRANFRIKANSYAMKMT